MGGGGGDSEALSDAYSLNLEESKGLCQDPPPDLPFPVAAGSALVHHESGGPMVCAGESPGGETGTRTRTWSPGPGRRAPAPGTRTGSPRAVRLPDGSWWIIGGANATE